MDIKDIILQYADSHDVISAKEISSDCAINIVTVRQYLSSMFRAGKLERVGDGAYTLRKRQEFSYSPSDDVKGVYMSLKASLPFADFCVYEGSIFAPLQHHLSINNAIYVETNRDVVENVFGRLKDEDRDVFRQPDRQFVYDYIDLKKRCVIVKALVSESPNAKTEGIVVPTLEKLLVDIQADSDFDYLRGSESLNMFARAFDLFSINVQRLMRYSRRRGLEQETKSLIDSAKQYD